MTLSTKKNYTAVNHGMTRAFYTKEDALAFAKHSDDVGFIGDTCPKEYSPVECVVFSGRRIDLKGYKLEGFIRDCWKTTKRNLSFPEFFRESLSYIKEEVSACGRHYYKVNSHGLEVTININYK